MIASNRNIVQASRRHQSVLRRTFSNSIRGERPSLVHSRVEVPAKPSIETIESFVEKVGATSIADLNS
jgi:hypothetical protein